MAVGGFVSETPSTKQDLQYGAGMLRRFGPLYFLSGISFLMRKIRMDERSENNIRTANENGPMVYVFYTKSKLDWLALNRVLNKKRLPLASVSLDMQVLWYRPILDIVKQTWGAFRRLLGKTKDVELLQQNIENNGVSAIFLTKAKGFFYTNTESLDHLLAIQKQHSHPIQLVPIAVVWQRKPTKVRSDLARFILGSEDQPGPLQKLLAVANRDHEPIVQAGDPVALSSILEKYETQPQKRQIRVVRLLLKSYLYRETHVIQGPKIKNFSWFRRQILLSPEVQDIIKSEAKEKKKSEAKIRAEVEKNIEHIAARFSFRILRFMALICRFIWHKIFSGVDLREEDIQRIKDAVRTGSPILVPSHRSHLDYLLMSSQCYEHGMVLPYIVAGENLSFFPLGFLFRGSGAFFIKRSFQKDKLFPIVFEQYVKLLIKEEIPVEFFIEGGRSRTGKLLHPKLGMLGMVVNAATELRSDKVVTILPIAFSYEQIAEEKSYAKELSGKQKRTESMQGVVKASGILRKRYGKVYIRVGEPILLNDVIANFQKKWNEMTPKEHKHELQLISEQIMFGIGQNMLILPTGITALALLSGHKPGVPLDVIHARTQRYDRLLRQQGAMAADSLSHGAWVVEQALARFLGEKWIERMTDIRGDIIRIIPESRITLEYYKNGLMHFLAYISLLACAIVTNKNECNSDETLRLFLVLSFVFRYEFPAHPDLGLEGLAKNAREAMVTYGALSKTEDNKYIVQSPEYLEELASITGNFIESYLCTLRGAMELQHRSMTAKELPKKIQEYGKARLATGDLLRPEALSSVNIDNALKAFMEEGVLQTRRDGSLQFDNTVLDQYIRDLQHVLDAIS